jgi:hypothetical protein
VRATRFPLLALRLDAFILVTKIYGGQDKSGGG